MKHLEAIRFGMGEWFAIHIYEPDEAVVIPSEYYIALINGLAPTLEQDAPSSETTQNLLYLFTLCFLGS